MVRVHAHARTVDTDLLTFRIDSGAKFGNQLAIDLNATIGDDFLAFTARAEARLSEKFLQANAFIVMIVRLGGARICVWPRSPNVAGSYLQGLLVVWQSFGGFHKNRNLSTI